MIQRREFNRMTALAAAAAAAKARAQNAPAAPAASNDGIAWDKAPCRFCGTGCHVRVGVKNGRVVAIEGDQLAEVNKGLLCVKGYHVGLALYGKDRLTQPLLRRNGVLEPISWEEAVETISQKIMAAPEQFAIYGSGQWTIPEGYAANKFIKAGLSSNHIDPNARLCMASAVTGFLSVYGVDEPAGCYDDLDKCDVLILWGNNMAEMHPVLFSRVIDRRTRGERVTLIDIGTRRTRTSEFCDHYLEFRPHSDLAIMNGIAHLLIKKNAFDPKFVEKFCNFRQSPKDPAASPTAPLNGEAMSFDDYKAALEPYTPEHVEKLSGVPAEKIRMLGDLFADKKIRITSTWCMGFNQHSRGTNANRLCHGIHLLSGHFGRPGDAPTSLTGQPSACGTAREVGTMCQFLPGGLQILNEEHRHEAEHIWNVPQGRIHPKIGHHTMLMWERFCTPAEKGGDIRTIWVQVTNPGQTLPNLHRFFKAKAGQPDKFLIVSDVYRTATTELADLVLPSAMWVEKNGMFGNSERRTQQWFRMVRPPGEARDDAWQMIAVARRLHDLGHAGMKDKDGRFLFTFKNDKGEEVPVWEWPRYYDVNVDKALFEEYRLFSRHKHKDLAPYDEYVKARGLRWPVVQQADGSWRETKFRFSEFDDPYVKKGAEIQFYHSVTKDDKALIWFAPAEKAAEEPDAEFPFWLCTGRVLEHWHSGSLTRRIPQLHASMPHSYVEMHPEDAREKGFTNGETITVRTRRGGLRLPVWIDGRGHPPRGSLFIPFFDERLLCNDITLGDIDPVSKQPDYKKCAAAVARA